MSTHLLKKRKPLTNINEDIKKSDSDTNGPSEKRKNKLRAKQSEIAVITADIAGPTIEASNQPNSALTTTNHNGSTPDIRCKENLNIEL